MDGQRQRAPQEILTKPHPCHNQRASYCGMDRGQNQDSMPSRISTQDVLTRGVALLELALCQVSARPLLRRPPCPLTSVDPLAFLIFFCSLRDGAQIQSCAHRPRRQRKSNYHSRSSSLASRRQDWRLDPPNPEGPSHLKTYVCEGQGVQYIVRAHGRAHH